MIRSVAFTVYAVNDLAAARRFYEQGLGLRLSRHSGDDWFEYDLGDTTFALSSADTEHPAPIRGAVVAFEVDDFDGTVERLKTRGVPFRREAFETPICRSAVVLDPSGNELIIHQRKR